MPDTFIRTRALLVAGLTVLGSAELAAAPINVQLADGDVVFVDSGPFALTDTVTADLFFDLDAANALSVELNITPTDGGPNFSRWTFSGTPPANTVSPYNQTAFTRTNTAGDSFVFDNPSFIDVEVVNDFVLDASNPFGLAAGTYDVLSVFSIVDQVDCPPGAIIPGTGACSDPNAPIVSGEHHGVNFVASSTWLDGIDALPTSLSAPGGFQLVGQIELFGSSGDAFAAINYASFTQAAVPAPSSLLLLVAGLVGTFARRRGGS